MRATVWKTIVGVGSVAGVLGAFYGIDKNYVRMNYHEVCFAQVKQDMTGIQEQISKQRAYDEVFFWQKMEVELTQAVAAHPNDTRLQKKLEDVRKKQAEAEERLKKAK